MLRERTRFSLALLAPLLTLFPRSAFACAVCLGGLSKKALHSYYVSTIMLTSLPFALIGMVVLAVYLARNREYRSAETSADAVPIGESRNRLRTNPRGSLTAIEE